MELLITSDVRMLVEPMNFTLQTKHVRKEGNHVGEEYWQNRGYYSTLNEALSRALRGTTRVLDEDNSVKRVKWVPEEAAVRVRLLLSAIAEAKGVLRQAAEGFATPKEAHGWEGDIIGNMRHKVLDNHD